MTKLLIYLHETVYARMRRISFETRRSALALVREAVDDWLNRDRKEGGTGG